METGSMFDDIIAGDINGHCLYDEYERWEDEDGDCDVYTGDDVSYVKSKKPKWQWKCKDGSLIELKDMTDKHLENSIKYCERTNSIDSLKRLQHEEKRRREVLKQKCFVLQKTNCQFCDSVMSIKKFDHESSPNWGPGMGWRYSDYRLVCECGAMGPVTQTEGFKP